MSQASPPPLPDQPLAFASTGNATQQTSDAGQMQTVWPMSVDAFLSGPYLNRADIVLTRKHRSLRSWLIRWATRGSFSHAAMVFLVPHLERGYDNSFVIESASKGVDLANLRHYLTDNRSVVGIKRLDRDWFDGGIRMRVRGRMLNSIESSYSYATALTIGFGFLNQLAFGMSSRLFGARKAIKTRRERQLQPPNEFICSGLVQLGYLHTIAEMIGRGEVAPRYLADVVFHPELTRFLPEDWDAFTPDERIEIVWEFITGFQEILEAVTPEDLARSTNLRWVYVVRAGKVYKVRSQKDAEDLLAWEPE